MKISSVFNYPVNLVKAYISLAKLRGALPALRFLVSENYYELKYKINSPYRDISMQETNQLAAQKDALGNVPGSYYLFHKGLSKINLPADKISFLDIGCGTGRFTSVAIQNGFSFVRGIDLDKDGLEIANKNAAFSSLKQVTRSNYEITFQDASKFVIPADVNVVYFFNPFGEKTMQDVIDNMLQSYTLHPRDLYIIYSLPVWEPIFLKAGFERIYSLGHKNWVDLSVLKLPEKRVQ